MNEVTASDIHPVSRALMIAVMVIIPLLVVILQRLPALREAYKTRSQNAGGAPDSEELPSDAGAAILICPNCFAQNPVQHSFCGFCGHKLLNGPSGDKQ